MVSGNSIAGKHNNIKDDTEGKLDSFARTLVAFLIKMLSFFRILWSRQDRRLNVHLSNALDLACNKNSTTEALKEDCVTSCMERLQKLELMLNELSNKPAEIPREKEHMILDSMDRIKCVEFDIHKTNKVSLLSHVRWPHIIYSDSVRYILVTHISLSILNEGFNFMDLLIHEVTRYSQCSRSRTSASWKLTSNPWWCLILCHITWELWSIKWLLGSLADLSPLSPIFDVFLYCLLVICLVVSF